MVVGVWGMDGSENVSLEHSQVLCTDFGGLLLEGDYVPTNCLLHDYTISEVDMCYNMTTHGDISSTYIAVSKMFASISSSISPTHYRRLFLNVLCNRLLLPVDATCCLERDTRNLVFVIVLQISLLFWSIIGGFFLVILLTFKISTLFDPTMYEEIPPFFTKTMLFMKDCAQLCIILAYVYFADRSSIFNVSSKVFFYWMFFPLLIIIFVCFAPFWGNTLNDQILNRSQTEEIKGWMQIVILVYHYTGRSSMLPVYMTIRLLVAGYLFLSGFGHFMYFWRTANFGIYRVFQVLVRYNLSTVIFCLIMDVPYEMYYFIPLITVWYVFGYIAMATWPRITDAQVQDSIQARSLYAMTAIKLLLLFLLVEYLLSNEERFVWIFSLLPFSSKFTDSKGSFHDWWFRLQLDRHAFLWGMVVAFVLCWWRSHRGKATLPTALYREQRRTQYISPLVCLIVILIYMISMTTCEDKHDCNTYHTKWSILPILSFVVLRNANVTFRKRFNIPCKFLGKFALELFLCQYHIWLAKDTRGILLLSSEFNLIFNFIITTILFTFFAHRLHSVQQNLLAYVI